MMRGKPISWEKNTFVRHGSLKLSHQISFNSSQEIVCLQWCVLYLSPLDIQFLVAQTVSIIHVKSSLRPRFSWRCCGVNGSLGEKVHLDVKKRFFYRRLFVSRDCTFCLIIQSWAKFIVHMGTRMRVDVKVSHAECRFNLVCEKSWVIFLNSQHKYSLKNI